MSVNIARYLIDDIIGVVAEKNLSVFSSFLRKGFLEGLTTIGAAAYICSRVNQDTGQ